jgi:putative addiction module antidote
MSELKLIAVGNSVGVILPRELLERLGVRKGDTLYGSTVQDGLQLSVRQSGFDEQMAVARRVMRERVAVLRELAK